MPFLLSNLMLEATIIDQVSILLTAIFPLILTLIKSIFLKIEPIFNRQKKKH